MTRCGLVASVVLSLWSAPAAAAAPAEVGCPIPFGEYDVRAIVNESKRAVFNDDAVSHKRLYAEFVRQVPCLDHQLAKDAWAQLLLDEAIVRNVAKVEWNGLLATALAIHTDLDVPQYILDAWDRGEPATYADTPIPPDATLFVDGVLQPRIPLLTGEHVVQVWRDGRWRSVYLDGVTPFPAEWLVPKPKEIVYVEAPDERWKPTGRGAAGLEFGIAVTSQLVEQPGTYLADANLVGGNSGIGVRGVQPFGSLIGAFYVGHFRIVAPSIRKFAGTPGFDAAPLLLPEGYFGPAVILEHLHVGAGGGLFLTQKVEAGVPDGMILPQFHAEMGVRQGRGAFDVGGGISPTAAHATMAGAWSLSKPGPLSWRLAVDAAFGTVWLGEVDPGTRHASVTQLVGAARIEAAWGVDR